MPQDTIISQHARVRLTVKIPHFKKTHRELELHPFRNLHLSPNPAWLTHLEVEQLLAVEDSVPEAIVEVVRIASNCEMNVGS